jgi:hypothetical protein
MFRTTASRVARHVYTTPPLHSSCVVVRLPSSRRALSVGSTNTSVNNTTVVHPAIKYAKTTAGTGDPEGLGSAGPAFSTRGPVTWPALGLVAIAAASAVAYYKIERERRLENAMGKIVSLGLYLCS